MPTLTPGTVHPAARTMAPPATMPPVDATAATACSPQLIPASFPEISPLLQRYNCTRQHTCGCYSGCVCSREGKDATYLEAAEEQAYGGRSPTCSSIGSTRKGRSGHELTFDEHRPRCQRQL